MSQYVGKVAWFNNAKGFGFLSREDGADTFVYYSAIQMEGYHTLKEGDEVEFDIEMGSAGKPQAANVKPLRAPAADAQPQPLEVHETQQTVPTP